MKPIKCDLSAELESVELYDLADFHIGDMMCDFKLVQALIDHVKDTPTAYCILGGDLMDTAISSSIGDTYGATHQPMEQLQVCVKLFEPIKDKILCILHGNHENRVYKSDGVDMTALMAAQLGIADRYSPTTALLFIRFGHDIKHNRRMCYTVYATHGHGGGRKEGGKINNLSDLASIVDADCYICGHVHLPASFKNSYYRTDTQNSGVQKVTKLFVSTASALEYGGYSDVQGYAPSANDYPYITFSGSRKFMRASV